MSGLSTAGGLPGEGRETGNILRRITTLSLYTFGLLALISEAWRKNETGAFTGRDRLLMESFARKQKRRAGKTAGFSIQIGKNSMRPFSAILTGRQDRRLSSPLPQAAGKLTQGSATAGPPAQALKGGIKGDTMLQGNDGHRDAAPIDRLDCLCASAPRSLLRPICPF